MKNHKVQQHSVIKNTAENKKEQSSKDIYQTLSACGPHNCCPLKPSVLRREFRDDFHPDTNVSPGCVIEVCGLFFIRPKAHFP